jgi:hypothetical protein
LRVTMRLTLRTLLAYLDDILDPADKEQLAKKIESSEFAEDLVHRTRDTMRRLRLSAPQVIGSGMGLDPNTVAEYLDNVLPPESVGDFERICLESDMHLAEAAACHHVLTMVLGEPADVDPRSRQRMYNIPVENDARRHVRIEPAHAPAGAVPGAVAAVQPVAAMPARPVAPATVSHEVPEYLRTSGWGGFRTALMALAAVLVIGAGLFFLVPGVREWVTGAPAATELASDTTASEDTTQETTADTTRIQSDLSSAQVDEPPDTGTPSDTPAVSGAASDPYAFPETTSQQDSQVVESATAPPLGADADSQPTTQVPSNPVEGGLPAQENQIAAIPPPTTTEAPAFGANEIPADQSAAAADAAQLEPGIDPATSDTTTSIADPLTDPTTAANALPDTAIAAAEPNIGAADASGDVTATPPVGVDESTAPAATEEVPAGPVELGTYLGRKTVLLKYDDANGGWFRVEPRAAVVPGNRLLALPQFRPKILLTSGVSLDVSGGTQLVMRTAGEAPAGSLPAADASVPVIELIYGRIVLVNTAADESQVRLKLGPAVADARLARNSTLGVEVVRQYVPGNDPRKTPSPIVASLYAPDGGVKWVDAAGEKSVDGASQWTITEGVTSEIAADPSPPDWIDHEPVGQLSEQRYAAPKVESTLIANRPADIQLLELFQTIEQREDKSLVAKCSIHVGVFQPFIEALRDSDQKSNWRAHIEALRAAMALGPESAEAVKKALDEQRGRPASDDLYEMLCGYREEQVGRTADQMKTGAVARLIDWLENDSLDYRVLAVHDLFEITGKRLLSDAASNQRERDRGVRLWRARLEDGELMPARR